MKNYIIGFLLSFIIIQSTIIDMSRKDLIVAANQFNNKEANMACEQKLEKSNPDMSWKEQRNQCSDYDGDHYYNNWELFIEFIL